MYTFSNLRKHANDNVSMDGLCSRLAITGDTSTQFLAIAVRGYAALDRLPLTVFDSAYNQIEAMLLDSQSELYAFRPDSILLWLSTNKLYENFLDMSYDSREKFAELTLDRVLRYWQSIRQYCKASILQMNFTQINDRALGNFSNKVTSTFTYQICKLNYLLAEKMSECNDVYPIDLLSIQVQLGASIFYDARLYYNAKMAISVSALPWVAKAILDVQKAYKGRIKKCVVLDLDNTLWGGIVGEDGLHNIQIGELGTGHVFTNFQRWLRQLKEYGIILCICSKNDEAIAKRPFEELGEMVLRLSDIAVFVANWEDKASNIRLIQRTLNIGMDAMVFIDDSPFERNLVRQMIPEIEVPELPEDPAQVLSFLQDQNYFETTTVTGDDKNRTKSYQAEFQRSKLRISFDSFDDYLISLEMTGEVRKFTESKYSRIAQLIQRSNQFNLRTIRYSEADVQRITEDVNCIAFYYNLQDKFSDYGLIGIVILRIKSKEELFIDTWIMSCRVLKRGMEEFMVNSFIREAKKRGFRKIYGEYIPTEKNKLVKDIYKELGFAETFENNYVLDINQFREKKTYIKEID